MGEERPRNCAIRRVSRVLEEVAGSNRVSDLTWMVGVTRSVVFLRLHSMRDSSSESVEQLIESQCTIREIAKLASLLL